MSRYLVLLPAPEAEWARLTSLLRAELLSRCGHVAAARAAFDEAIGACGNDLERAHLVRQQRALPGLHRP